MEMDGFWGHWALPDHMFFPQCELSALEGMKACMTHFPRACGSLKVSVHKNSSSYQHDCCLQVPPLRFISIRLHSSNYITW